MPSVNRKALLDALQTVMPAANGRSTKPILACVLIDGHTVQATDLEHSIRYTMDESAGVRCCVRPDKLAAILKESSDDTVTVELKDETLTVRTTSGRFKLTAMPADEFPAVEAIEGETFVVGGLGAMMRRVSFAADRRESGARWAVTGVLMETTGETLNVVATDTKRLAIASAPCPAAKTTALIPGFAAAIVERMPGDVQVTLGKSGASFGAGPVLIVTRLVEGKFPPYREILPKKTTHTVPLNREQFLAAVRQAGVMVDKESARMEFEFGKDGIEVRANSAEQGDSKVVVQSPFDFEMEIAFDPSYLTDFLKATDAAEVTLKLNASEKPAVFEVGGDYRYLVMPLAG